MKIKREIKRVNAFKKRAKQGTKTKSTKLRRIKWALR